jgi:hypothetical protein
VLNYFFCFAVCRPTVFRGLRLLTVLRCLYSGTAQLIIFLQKDIATRYRVPYTVSYLAVPVLDYRRDFSTSRYVGSTQFLAKLSIFFCKILLRTCAHYRLPTLSIRFAPICSVLLPCALFSLPWAQFLLLCVRFCSPSGPLCPPTSHNASWYIFYRKSGKFFENLFRFFSIFLNYCVYSLVTPGYPVSLHNPSQI